MGERPTGFRALHTATAVGKPINQEMRLGAGALEAFHASLSEELRERLTILTCVDVWDRAREEERGQNFSAMVYRGRYGEPEDLSRQVAEMALCLCRNLAAMMQEHPSTRTLIADILGFRANEDD